MWETRSPFVYSRIRKVKKNTLKIKVMNKKIELRSIADCKELIGKRVKFKYHRQERTGVVKDFYQEGRKIYFKIMSDNTQGITHINMFDLIEETDEIIKDDTKYTFIVEKL